MKTAEKREKFIILRADNYSYDKITKELGISKSTCIKWGKELAEDIQRAKNENIESLYSMYRMSKEEHIKKLGEALKRIDAAIAEKDLTEVPADKLLKLKLEYEDRLQAQYNKPTEEAETFKDYNADEMLKAVSGLYERLKAGAITLQQAKAELITLEGVRRAIAEQYNEKFIRW